ncbi:aryl hydrocarbon receptor 1a [Pygocentrus nattereri]|uniref:aryl hydrocarbon receptor 1a n=1 Tax=Pygocentrus nattereri TaxID=42514 RepID=UPI001890C30F|nr:aryl hydrocarbon receptor 1a [Pygocentrus nattereri]
MSASSVYASRKRRKPSKKSVKPPSAEVAKSNPSKRHRDRLNGELDRLASLLPFHQDVISKLDKLTILRLSVGYLRAKGHFSAALNPQKSSQPANSSTKAQILELSEGELLLQVLHGFVLVVTAGGTVFYVSTSVKDYLGFHQSDIVHQSVYELIHTDDRAEFRRQLHWALKPSESTDTTQLVRGTQDSRLPLTYYNPEQLPPENSAFLERNFICRLRCLLDNSSGFLAMNFQGRLKFLHGQNGQTADGKRLPSQLALFALACPLQPPSILEIRAKNYFFKTKHKLDFTPIACDAIGKIVLGYTEEELCYRGSGYQFIHAADMLYCAENHVRMMKTGESGLTVFRLLTKVSGWVWVQANARIIFKAGRPEFIIASQRVLTEEEGEENLKKRSLMLPFSFTTGEAVLYDFSLPKSFSGFSGSDSSGPVDSPQPRPAGELDPNSLLGSMLKQDKSIYVCAAGLNEAQGCSQEPDEEEFGGIFSSNLQESVLSLAESSLFKQDLAFSCGGEESSQELLSFMGSLGISPDDLQDELFLNGEFNGGCVLEDLTDEVLSYVQESLRNNADVQASLEENHLLGSVPQTQDPSLFPSQGLSQEPFALSPASYAPQFQQQPFIRPSEPKIYMQSYLKPQPMQEHQQSPQGYLYEPCAELFQGQKLQPPALQPELSLNPQQHVPYPVNHSCVQNPEPMFHSLKHIQGNSSGLVSAPNSGPSGSQLPPGRFYWETSPLGLEPCRNQLTAHCSQEFPCSYISTGDSRVDEFSAQDLEDLLNSLDGVGQQKHGQSGEVQREEWCPWKPAGEL